MTFLVFFAAWSGVCYVVGLVMGRRDRYPINRLALPPRGRR